MKLAYFGLYLMEIRTLWATCAANLIWTITWVPNVRIGRLNSPREDIGIFYKSQVVQQSKSNWSSPESGLKVSLRIFFQNPTCFRKLDLFLKETIKNTIIIRVCIIRDRPEIILYWERKRETLVEGDRAKD